jgi:hypothetical protein
LIFFTNAIVDNTHLNTFKRFSDQRIPNPSTDIVTFKHIVLYVDVLLGILDIAKQLFKLLCCPGIETNIVTAKQRGMVEISQQAYQAGMLRRI